MRPWNERSGRMWGGKSLIVRTLLVERLPQVKPSHDGRGLRRYAAPTIAMAIQGGPRAHHSMAGRAWRDIHRGGVDAASPRPGLPQSADPHGDRLSAGRSDRFRRPP